MNQKKRVAKVDEPLKSTDESFPRQADRLNSTQAQYSFPRGGGPLARHTGHTTLDRDQLKPGPSCGHGGQLTIAHCPTSDGYQAPGD